jgi:hypothetical protein
MGVAVANEASALERLIDGSFEDPEVLIWLTQRKNRLGRDTAATIAKCQPEESCVGDVPSAFNVLHVSRRQRQAISLS